MIELKRSPGHTQQITVCQRDGDTSDVARGELNANRRSTMKQMVVLRFPS